MGPALGAAAGAVGFVSQTRNPFVLQTHCGAGRPSVESGQEVALERFGVLHASVSGGQEFGVSEAERWGHADPARIPASGLRDCDRCLLGLWPVCGT